MTMKTIILALCVINLLACGETRPACGGIGEPCCSQEVFPGSKNGGCILFGPGPNNGWTECQSGTCVHCGQPEQPCCTTAASREQPAEWYDNTNGCVPSQCPNCSGVGCSTGPACDPREMTPVSCQGNICSR